MIGQILQYFAMVSGALFLPYVAYQKCKPSTTTTGAGATYNHLHQAAPAPAAVTSTAIHQEIQVGGAPAEARPAEPHQGACLILEPNNRAPGNPLREKGGAYVNQGTPLCSSLGGRSKVILE